MKRLILAVLCAGLTALANADEGVPQRLTVTWQDCVQMAARNNPDLLAAIESMASSHAGYKGSYNGILPQLSLSNSYSKSRSSGVESKGWNLSGNASLNLIDFGQWATIQSALASYKESQANVQIVANTLLLNLYKAFTSVLYTQEAIQVDSVILDAWKNNAQMVNLRYQSGRESKGNNMNTEAQLLQAESSLNQSTRGLRVAQQQLNQAIGRDAFSALVVTGTWVASEAPRPQPDLNTLVMKQPRIQAQEARLEQARAAIKRAHSTLWPTLSLNYSQGTQGPTEFPQNPYWTFGGAVNYPLFAGGPTATYYASVAAERGYEKSRQDLRSLRNQTLSDLESAWAAFATAEDTIRVQRAFLLAAKQRKDESDIRYRSGLMTFENWIIVIQDYVNFQQSFLRAEQNLILAEAQWRFASGEQIPG